MKKKIIVIIICAFAYMLSVSCRSVYASTGISRTGSCSPGSSFGFSVGANVTVAGESFSLNDSRRGTAAEAMYNAGCWRGMIESVQWAAVKFAIRGGTNCALWVGDPTGVSTVTEVKIDNISNINLPFYGMCTTAGVDAVNVGLTYATGNNSCGSGCDWSDRTVRANKAIVLFNAVPRDRWSNGTLTQTDFSMNREVFEEKIVNRSSEGNTENGYRIREANLNLWRCHDGNETSCSYNPVTIRFKIKEPAYYSKSSVSIEKVGAGDSESRDTGIVTDNWDAMAELDKSYNVGDRIKITITHKLYSDTRIESARYKVYGSRWNDLDGNSSYSQFVHGDILSEATANLNVRDGSYYTTSGNTRTSTYEVVFNNEGFYTYCEGIQSTEASHSSTAVSSACANIQIGQSTNEDYAQSWVSVSKSDGSDNHTAHTDVTNSEDQDYSQDNYFRVGESVKVAFSHRIYSSVQKSDASWEVKGKRYGNLWSNGSYNSSVVSAFPSGQNLFPDDSAIVSGNSNLNKSMNVGGKNLYGINDGTREYVVRNEYNLSFSRTGEWTYCETMEFGGASTTACAKINVGSSSGNSYYGQANMAVRESNGSGSDYQTTGIVMSGGNVERTINVVRGDTKRLIFSHNVYNNSNSGSTSWSVSKPNFSVSGISASSVSACGSSGNLNSWEGSSTEGRYIGNPRSCSDSGGSRYVSRDDYRVTFNRNGQYEFCEILSVGGEQKTSACVKVIVGGGRTSVCDDWYPGYSSANTTSTISGTQNPNARYSNWATNSSRIIYAKPGDTVNWAHCYYPGVQRRSNEITTVNNSHPHPSRVSGNVYSLNNASISSWGLWENCWSVSQNNMSSRNGMSRTCYGIGDAEARLFENTYNVRASNVSDILKETTKTGSPTSITVGSGELHTWRCNAYSCNPHDCHCHGDPTVCSTCYDTCYETCTHGSDYFYSSSRSGTASTSAVVHVPYNFDNEVHVELDSGNVYAGETKNLSSLNVTVNQRRNDTTNGTYATYVMDAKIKLISFVSDSDRTGAPSQPSVSSGDLCNSRGILNIRNGRCKQLQENDNLTFNSSGDTRDIADESFVNLFSPDYNVYDEEAGKYFCVAVGIYPANSGSDTNIDSYGSDSWYVSSPDCRVISKRPTFQVRGGSVYSNGSINTSAIVKNNLKDDTSNWPYNNVYDSNTKRKVFSSWAEQSVILGGITKSFASGAATNKKITVDASGTKNVQYGSEEGSANYCRYRTPLSFANYDNDGCPNMQQTGNSGITISKNKDSIINYWWPLDTVETSVDSVNLGQDSNYTETKNLAGDDILDIHRNGDLTINGGSISYGGVGSSKALPRIVRSEDNITISDNIQYEIASGETISSPEMIPKLIIYAKKNINIQCDVTRIDAILIAEGTVDTCSNGGSESSAVRSNQLTINGAILANQVQLNRTFGASTGKYSGIPAEIINYDTSFILWGRTVSEADDFQTYSTVYQQELAPRY